MHPCRYSRYPAQVPLPARNIQIHQTLQSYPTLAPVPCFASTLARAQVQTHLTNPPASLFSPRAMVMLASPTPCPWSGCCATEPFHHVCPLCDVLTLLVRILAGQVSLIQDKPLFCPGQLGKRRGGLGRGRLAARLFLGGVLHACAGRMNDMLYSLLSA